MKPLFDQSTFSFGSEFEFGDIVKTIDGKLRELPSDLGKWENCENCIINLSEPYRGVACDPLGINPPVGGEINVVPAYGWQGGAEKFNALLDFFPTATTSFLCFNHIHVHVPELVNSTEGLSRIGQWIEDNQDTLIDACCNFDDDAFMVERPVKSLFGTETEMVSDYDAVRAKCVRGNRVRRELMDGGRKHPKWLTERLKNATNYKDWCKDHQSGESRRGMPIRYGINTYCMKHIQTIEFRMFRATTDQDMVRQQFECAHEVMNAMVNTGESMQSIFDRHPEWKPWPKLWFDADLWNKYNETKIEGHLLQNKNRVLLEVEAA